MPTPNRVAALSLALQESIKQAVAGGVEVTTLSLPAAEAFVPSDEVLARVNVALIRIAVLPTLRRPPARPGPTSAPSPLPLEIRYLVTCYSDAGTAAEHSVERVLEGVLQHLDGHSIFSAAELSAALSGSEITGNVELVFDPQTISELKDVFIHCGAKWRPALAYVARVAQ
jgi:hypothetical protein